MKYVTKPNTIVVIDITCKPDLKCLNIDIYLGDNHMSIKLSKLEIIDITIIARN